MKLHGQLRCPAACAYRLLPVACHLLLVTCCLSLAASDRGGRELFSINHLSGLNPVMHKKAADPFFCAKLKSIPRQLFDRNHLTTSIVLVRHLLTRLIEKLG